MKKMWKLVIILTLVILILLSGHVNAIQPPKYGEYVC